MSLEHIKQLVYTKYDEIYNTKIIYYEPKIEIEKFIYDLLEKYDNNKVMYIIKELFNIEFKYNELESSKICRNDDEFKKAVFERDKTCIICDTYDCHKSSYQVAHIYDFSKCETELEKYDVNNGILLCANMHKYFDDLLMKFIPDGIFDNNYVVKIVFCETMSDYICYKKYNGKKLSFNKDNIIYIEKKNNSNKNICI